MTYQIDIHGMHCNGCIQLITLCLEETGWTDVQVTEGHASLVSDMDRSEIEAALNIIFNSDLSNYHYSNLTIKE